jgi:hypothetical protein
VDIGETTRSKDVRIYQGVTWERSLCEDAGALLGGKSGILPLKMT